MSTSTPNQLLRISPTPYASGQGLFTTRAVQPGELVMHVKDPLIAMPDDKHLDSCCAGCMRYQWKDLKKEGQGQKQEEYPDPGIEDIEEEIKLVRCSGCKVVWYCGKDCQKLDWKRGHKYECPIYKPLQAQGKILPASVRVLVRLLLLKKFTAAAGTWWGKVLRLQGHEKEQSRVRDRAEMVPVMSKAGEVYSGSGEGEDVVRGVYCRTLVNSFSITSSRSSSPQKEAETVEEEVIGNLFDPDIALFNHSCEPNCVVEFIGREVFVYTLKEVKAGEEATVAYVDAEGVEIGERRRQLRETWFFECECARCVRELGRGSSISELEVKEREGDARIVELVD